LFSEIYVFFQRKKNKESFFFRNIFCSLFFIFSWLFRFLIAFSFFFTLLQTCLCADLVIEIPGSLGQDDSFYRLDYYPPHGIPPPNTTIASRDVGDEIQFSQGLPGTRYNFWLYYTNSTHHNRETWTVSITTAPDPPSNLSVAVRSGKNAIISWSPPTQGNFTSFKLKVRER
jgi:receptor-type tyrosine-protein phosphatase beta